MTNENVQQLYNRLITLDSVEDLTIDAEIKRLVREIGLILYDIRPGHATHVRQMCYAWLLGIRAANQIQQ